MFLLFTSVHQNNAGRGIERDLRERMFWTRMIIKHHTRARNSWEFRSTADGDGFRYMCCQPAEKSVAFTSNVRNNPLGTKRNLFYLNTQSVPRSKHFIPVIKTNQLLLYRAKVTVCSEIHTKHVNALCGQKAEYLNVKNGSW